MNSVSALIGKTLSDHAENAQDLAYAYARKKVAALPSIPAMVIARHATENHMTEPRAREIFAELLLFLWASAETGHAFIPSAAVDEAWHTFILFMREYEDWCEHAFGKKIYHQPLHATPVRGASPAGYAASRSALAELAPLTPALWEEGAWSTAPATSPAR